MNELLTIAEAARRIAAKDLSPVDDNFDPKDPKNANSGLVWHYGGMIDPKPKAPGTRVEPSRISDGGPRG